jgi:hypothetical protein
MTSSNRDLVFGEAADSFGFGLGYLAVCERPSGGGTQTFGTLTSCTSSTTSADWVEIYGSPGGDRIAPLTSNIGTITCGTGGNKILPFAWSFPAAIAGLGGSDLMYGTANNDLLVSNVFGSASGDSSNDILCGMNGDDALYGDGDDSSPAPEEWLDGGPGSDYCASVLGGGDFSPGDVAANCETIVGSFIYTTSGGSAGGACAGPTFW